MSGLANYLVQEGLGAPTTVLHMEQDLLYFIR